MRSKKTSSWTHPIHARGIKSPQYDCAAGFLTDKKIDEYILRGRYGEEAQKALIEERKKRKPQVDPVKKFFERAMKKILGL
jgi:hypothetical protein